MNVVNAALGAIFLATAGCAIDSVPESDKAAAAFKNGDIAAAQIHIRKAMQEGGWSAAANRGLVFLSGKIALEAGDPERAKSEFQQLLADPEFGPRARPLLAKALLMAGQGREALRVLGSQTPASGLEYAVSVSAHLVQGQSDRSIALLDQGLAAFPQSPDLIVLDGTRALQNGDTAKARSRAAQAVKLAPRDVNALLFAGRVAMVRRDFAEAVRRFDAVLALRPRHQTALLAQAAIAYDRGQHAQAEKMLKEAAVKLDGASPTVNFFLAQLAYDAGDTEKANRILQSMGDLKRLPAAGMLAGLVAAKRGQKEQAIALLSRFLDKGGEDGRARFALATVLRDVGSGQEAWRALQPLADAANANRATLQLAVGLASELNLPAAAGYRAREAIAAKGDPLAREMIAADKALRAGQWGQARTIYARLLQGHPDTTNVVLLNNAASVLVELDRAGDAVPLARRALSLAPGDPVVLDTLGWALFKSGGPRAEAASLLRKAVQTMPGNPEIAMHFQALANAPKAAL